MAQSKADRARYMREWNLENREIQKAKKHAWYLQHRDKILADMKAFRQANPEWCQAEAKRRLPYMRRHHMKRKYGAELETIVAMYEAQDGCAICHTPFPPLESPKPFHVDHNHRTGKLRELLCFSCNQAVGSLKDSSTRAYAAGDYLAKHGC